jgi:hypothetical protein
MVVVAHQLLSSLSVAHLAAESLRDDWADLPEDCRAELCDMVLRHVSSAIDALGAVARGWSAEAAARLAER